MVDSAAHCQHSAYCSRAYLLSLPKDNHSRRTEISCSDHKPGAALVARLGLFDATMVVMGGIVGSGIFINPYVVAQLVHTPALILGTWIAGGVIALAGAFIYAELADRMPEVGGQYAYIREAYHPLVGFLYGWVSLLVIHAGGTAAVAVTFANYARAFSQGVVPEKFAAVAVVLILTIINCLGVGVGSRVQSFFMVLRILAIAMIVVCGAWLILRTPAVDTPAVDSAVRPSAFVRFVHRVWRRNDSGAICIRGIPNFELRRQRNPRAAKEFAASASVGRHRSDRSVPLRKFYICRNSVSRGTGRHFDAGVGSDAPLAGRARRFAGGHHHRNFHAGISEPVHACEPARSVRHG